MKKLYSSLLLTLSLALLLLTSSCDITGGGWSSVPELEFVSEDIIASAEALDEVIAHMSSHFLTSARVKLRDIEVWESLDEYYAQNQHLLTLHGIKGMNINYSAGRGVSESRFVDAVITPQYELFMNVIVAYENATTAHLTPDELTVYRKAREIIRDTVTNAGLVTAFDKAHALHEYLLDNVEYDHFHAVNESAFDVYGALIQGAAVCQGYTQAYKLLLHMANIENIIVLGTAGGENHAWNLVNYGGSFMQEWYHVDVTWNDHDSGNSNKYFNVSDRVMSATHRWNTLEYPAANHMRYNYFNYRGRTVSTMPDLENLFARHYSTELLKGETVFFEVLCRFPVNDTDLRFVYTIIDRSRTVQFSSDSYGGNDTLLMIAVI
jgi:hypothetical protein